MFRSLHHVQDLKNATQLGKAKQELPSNFKELWAMDTAKKKRSPPTLLEFNNWFKEKAEADEMMKVTKPKTDDISTAITKTKTSFKVFASTSKADAPTVGRSVLPTQPIKCTACK